MSLFMQKICFALLFLLSIAIPMLVSTAASAVSTTTIFIQPDGTVNPSNVPIQRNGDIYTFTANVYDPILVQKSNVTLDGAGYSLKLHFQLRYYLLFECKLRC